MATVPVSSIGQARSLAQSCWTRCRDSASSFKLLTSSIRKLRNILEDIEDVYDDSRTLGPDDLKLLDNVIRANELLHQLDNALNASHEPNMVEVSESGVADIKTGLDVTDRDLRLAYEAVTTGEIPLQLDTNVRPRAASHGVSSSSYTPDSTVERQSSHASSSWSTVYKDTADTPSSVDDEGSRKVDAQRQSHARDDSGCKEDVTSVIPSNSTSEDRRPSLDWRSPFASPDPMSISIEQASTLILNPDDDIISAVAVRSRSGTSSTVVVDPPEIKLPPPEQASTAPAKENPNASQMAWSTSAVVRVPSRPIESSGGNVSSVRPASQGDRIDTHMRRSSEVGHLSPLSATREYYGRHRAYSASSATGGTATTRKAENKAGAEASYDRQGQSANLPLQATTTVLASRIPITNHDMVSKTDNGLGVGMEIPTLSDNGATQIRTQSARAPASSTSIPGPPQQQQGSPAMPTRKPPPPPPSPRRVKTANRVSSYRIVNASPVEDPSSDEDLYTSSRPSSPKVATSTPTTPSPIPRVNVEDHDLGIRQAAVTQMHEAEGAVTSALEGQSLRNTTLSQPARSGSYDGEAMSEGPPHANHMSVEESTSEPQKDRIVSTPVPSSTPPVPEDVPPPIPPRPARYRRRSSAQPTKDRFSLAGVPSGPIPIAREDVTMLDDKELMLEPGLEVRRLGDEWGLQVWHSREAESGLEVNLARSRPVRSMKFSRTSGTTPPEVAQDVEPNTDAVLPQVAEWYGPGSETSFPELEKERINHIIHFWNTQAWDQAEAYLTDYLTAVIEEDSRGLARRIRHLLAVCASFQGEFSRAIPLFLSAMRTPILDISDLDDGDCAAAYWLGDIYALTNQRTEALLAYSIAERSSLFQLDPESSIGTLIGLEQEAVQLGKPKADFKLLWSQVAFRSSPSAEPDSILDTKIVTSNAAKVLFDNQSRIDRKKYNSRDGPYEASNLDRYRSNSLFLLEYSRRIYQASHFHNIKLIPSHFLPNTTWPMMYDPFFSISNVQRGRLLTYECDLVNVFSTNEAAKVPRAGTVGLSKMDSFTSDDLLWLVKAVRDCLRTYEMEWSEVATVATTAFLVRYSFMLDKLATTYYFTIRLFKQTLRTGYGVDICPDGIGSSRHIRRHMGYEKGVSQEENKRIKKLIREHLEAAEKQKSRPGRKPSFQRLGRSQDEERPSPIPARPTSAFAARQT